MFWMLAFASMTTSPSRGPILNGQLTHRGAGVVVRVVGPRPVTQSYTPQATMYATARGIWSEPAVFNPAAARMSESHSSVRSRSQKSARRPPCRHPLDMREAGGDFAAVSMGQGPGVRTLQG